MILICTDRDLDQTAPKSDLVVRLNEEALLAAARAEDVYFWRNGEVKPLKRRNAPLEVPEWLQSRTEVDR